VKQPLRILFVVAVIDILGFGILIPLVPYMADRFGAEPRTITWILGSYSLCQLIAAPFWGRLSDRYGRRPILMSSLAGACVSYAMLAFAHNVEWLLASRMLAGFMAGNLSAAFAYASDVSKPEHRAKSMGMIGAAIGIGFMLGPAIGGALAGDNEDTANFMLPAMLSAALTVVAILLVVFVLPESHPAHERRKAHEAQGAGPLQLLAQRPALRFVAAAALLVTIAQGILESIFAIWAMHQFGFGPRTVGLLLFGLAIVAVTMQGGLVRVLAPRIGDVRLATIGVATYVTGMVIVSEAGDALGVAIFGLALCGLGAGAFNPTASAMASKQSRPNDRGSVMGTYQASTSLARVIGPFIAGPVYAMLGPGAPFLAGACLMAPAMWLIWHAQKSSAPVEQSA
jgi:MFS transporter, DHA1 family, tetracycline resistance protein